MKATRLNTSKRNIAKHNLLLLLLVVVITCIPFMIAKKGKFLGTDDKAEKTITEINPDFKPWFDSLWTPPSGEVESLLFASEAGLGCLIIGYYIGYARGKKKNEDDRP